jgi:hypothetical protein
LTNLPYRFICLLLLAVGYVRAAGEPTLDSLYEANQWFQLRDAVRNDKTAPAFYRGVVELAFHDWENAERDLRAAADSAPATVTVDTVDRASEAASAMDALSDLYALAGRYKEAADEFDRYVRAASTLGLDDKSAQEAARALKSYRALYSVLGRYVDQSVAARGYSQLPYSTIHSSPVVQVAIGGSPSTMMLDTGSSANYIGPSEARRLGLMVYPAAVPLGAYDGATETTQGVAVANELTIGNFRLRNVAFFVLSEDDDDVPGLLGLPVLFAVGTVRWSSGGMLELGFASQPAEANLAFRAGAGLLTEAILGAGDKAKDKLTLRVDTGTDETLLFPSFAKSLGRILENPIGETLDREALLKRGVTLRVAGFDAPLGAGMPALSNRTTGDFDELDGNLGLDILGQQSTIAFDLLNMRVTVGVDTASPVEPVTAAPVTGSDLSTLAAANLTDTELRELLKQSVEEGNLDFEPSRDYVYTEDKETRFLDAKGNVLRSEAETHESIELYGGRYERLIRKDGKPLSTKEERAEQEKLDKETNRRKQESADPKAKRLAQRQTCSAEFIDWFRFSLLGVEDLNGRPAWKIQADPISGGSSECGEKMVKRFRLSIWIDQADKKWAKVVADNIALVTWGAFLVRAPAGAMHIAEELTRRGDGAWLPAFLRVHLDAKLILLKTAHMEILSTYGDYRKFQSDSRLLQ